MNTHILMILTGILLLFSTCNSQVDRLEQNKNLVLKANQELLNNGNTAYVDSVFAEDYRVDGAETGREAIKNFISTLLQAFPDLEVTIEPVLAEGDLVGWQRTHTGTHRGQIMGIPASNQQITWENLIISRIVDGKIVEEWSQGNLQQKLQAIEAEN
ncbi:MAG: ester cyclase [Gracilimonas sp.]|uniref:ester cyclase n=1 Tax=Gracilimonas sp. TaxID=1974203 RepID=UPI0019ABC7DF|nr:ester cyclase [Gracilimonas sp.]MBD3616063.1 ester cyclase [Gracilimonas sp.]